MLSLRSEAEDFPQSSAQARPTTPSAEVESSLSTRRGRTQAAMWLAELPSKHSGFGLSPVGAHP